MVSPAWICTDITFSTSSLYTGIMIMFHCEMAVVLICVPVQLILPGSSYSTPPIRTQRYPSSRITLTSAWRWENHSGIAWKRDPWHLRNRSRLCHLMRDDFQSGAADNAKCNEERRAAGINGRQVGAEFVPALSASAELYSAPWGKMKCWLVGRMEERGITALVRVTVLVLVHGGLGWCMCVGVERITILGARYSQLLGSHLQVCKNVQECKYIININNFLFLSFYLSFMWTIFLFVFCLFLLFIIGTDISAF